MSNNISNKNKNMVGTIIAVASAFAIIMAACVGLIGFNHIQKAYLESFSEGLHAAAIIMEDEISHEWEGDWSLSEDGQLLKGDVAIHLLTNQVRDQLNRIRCGSCLHTSLRVLHERL